MENFRLCFHRSTDQNCVRKCYFVGRSSPVLCHDSRGSCPYVSGSCCPKAPESLARWCGAL